MFIVSEKRVVASISYTARYGVCGPLIVIAVGWNNPASAAQPAFITIDNPLGVNGTVVDGVYGSEVCGYYVDATSVKHGFLYDGTSFTPLDDPLATASTMQPDGTEVRSIYKNIVVGGYTDSNNPGHGFIYDGSSFTQVDFPTATKGTALAAYSGSVYVGNFSDAAGYHGFSYSGSFFTAIKDPIAPNNSAVDGVFGNTVVGYYFKSGGDHGFIYDGSSYTTVDDPLAVKDDFFSDMSSLNNMVGAFADSNDLYHGFFYDGSSFTTVDDPLGTQGTILYGVDSTTMVGAYTDSNGLRHGFEAFLPEPGSIASIALGACGIGRTRRRNQHGK